MALPEIDVDFSRKDESGRILLDQADLSFHGKNPVGWKAFFCDGVSGAVGTIEEGPVARLWHPPFVLDITPGVPPRVQRCLALLSRLEEVRAQWKGQEEEDPQEDVLLDEMDVVWYAMTPDEIEIMEHHAQKRGKDHAD